MKKVLLLVALLLFVFTLSACEAKQEIECVDTVGGTELFVYDSDGLLEYYVDGEAADDDIVEYIETTFNLAFGGDDFSEVMDNMLDSDEIAAVTTCTKK